MQTYRSALRELIVEQILITKRGAALATSKGFRNLNLWINETTDERTREDVRRTGTHCPRYVGFSDRVLAVAYLEGRKLLIQDGLVRSRNAELVVPVVFGTVAFHLGKKATEYSSHRWTAYLRSQDNEDLSHIFSKVVFQLHHSFQTPTRELKQPPYELTEHGWGEFEIVITMHFAEDAQEPPIEIFHKLKLYPDDAAGIPSKKPVVHEQFEELVFSEPVHAFHQRVANQVPVPAPPYSVAQQFLTLAPGPETQRYAAVRQKVAQMRAQMQRQLDALH